MSTWITGYRVADLRKPNIAPARDGRIVFVGSKDQCESWASENNLRQAAISGDAPYSVEENK